MHVMASHGALPGAFKGVSASVFEGSGWLVGVGGEGAYVQDFASASSYLAARLVSSGLLMVGDGIRGKIPHVNGAK